MLTCRSTAENSSEKIQPVLLCTRSCVKFSPTGAFQAGTHRLTLAVERKPARAVAI
jgi:hypothetical protein